MPQVQDPIGDPTDPENSWKTGGGGGGSSRFTPPGAGIGGVGGAGGGIGGVGGGLGFDYRPPEGFDPMNEMRRRLAGAFGRGGQRPRMFGGMRPGIRPGFRGEMRPRMNLGGQQPMDPTRPGEGGQAGIDPQVLQKMFAMFGGGGGGGGGGWGGMKPRQPTGLAQTDPQMRRGWFGGGG